MEPVIAFRDLTIVTSCTGYGKYLAEWSGSILAQTVRPGRVCIMTHGSERDYTLGVVAARKLIQSGIDCAHAHSPDRLDLGVARNAAVELAKSEWVMHLDADDMLVPSAVSDLMRIAPTADVVQAGYERVGSLLGTSTRKRLYTGGDGEEMLGKTALASGNSMFRRSLWEAQPYRTDLLGAWDTCLWIGFARLGARFRPSATVIFRYRQHSDSIYNRRRAVQGWERVHTSAMIKAMRRNYRGVAIIVPRDLRPGMERERNWRRVRAHYAHYHPEWEIIEGFCPTVTWVKGAAIADALGRCSAEILVLADADVLIAPDALRQSVEQVRTGSAWAMPHEMVYRVDARMSESYCANLPELPTFPYRDATVRAPYLGMPGGGLVVLKHAMYHAIGGIPLAFRGWGSEDQCLALLCEKLLGTCARGNADLLHLWHPPQGDSPHGTANGQVLRKLGHAALQGRTSLVQAVAALPVPPGGVVHHRHPPKVSPINHAAIEARMAARRTK